jgi:release factor glutamine methyltransferase
MTFDFILSNPPYVSEAEYSNLSPSVRSFEPYQALVAGARGTEVIERLIPQAAERLVPGGWLIFEISPMICEQVCELMKAEPRFELGPVVRDLARLPRVIQARRL